MEPLGLIIAEKPSVANSISYAVNQTSTRADGYLIGDKYITTFVFGHMYELFDAKDYNIKLGTWSRENYPFIPSEFKYKERNDNGVKKQLKTIKELINRNDISHVIIATDGDLEGQLIGATILNQMNIKKPLKRLWISSHTPEEVKKGMSNMKSYSEYKNLESASYCRQHMDWVIGINYTVLSTISYGNNKLLAVGRIILPTLKLIYDRDIGIETFKKEPYYELKAIFSHNKIHYDGICMDKDKKTKFKDRNALEKIKTSIEGKHGIILEKEVKKITERAPLLFNLTDLQGQISTKYNISPDKTKNIAQKLYEKAYITYPRTASRHLDDTQISEIEKIINTLKDNYPEDYNIKFKIDKRLFDSSKVDSHPALTPTYITPTNINKEETLVYNEIRNRFIAQFMPPNEYEQTTIVTNVENYNFITKEKILTKEGWIKLYKEESNSSKSNLKVKENDIVKIEHLQILDKETEPPNKYTEKTLLSAMEHCGKNVLDEDMDNILKGYSIGTADTRGSTIKRILELGYIEKKGKTLTTTSLGRELVEVFPVKELLDTDFTGKIQKSLKDIEKGKVKSEVFMERMKHFVINNSNRFKKTELKTIAKNTSNDKDKQVIGKCPECGNDIIEGKKAYGCSNWKNGCKFTIWYNQLEKLGMKKINKTTAKKLLHQKETELKLKSQRTGKNYVCPGKLIKENEKWVIKLEFK